MLTQDLVSNPSAKQLQEAGYRQIWNTDFTQSQWVDALGQIWGGQPVMAFATTTNPADRVSEYIQKAGARSSIQAAVAIAHEAILQQNTVTIAANPKSMEEVESSLIAKTPAPKVSVPTTDANLTNVPIAQASIPNGIINSFTSTASSISSNKKWLYIGAAVVGIAVVIFIVKRKD